MEKLDVNVTHAADLQTINDLRNAIYHFEYKTIVNLQLINGGGAAALAGFLSHSSTAYTLPSKWAFLAAITLFIVGLLASLWLAIIYPAFMEARYQQNATFKKNNNIRIICTFLGIGCFILAIVSSMLAWLSS